MEDIEDKSLSIVEQVMAHWALEMRHISTTSPSSSSLELTLLYWYSIANYKANLQVSVLSPT